MNKVTIYLRSDSAECRALKRFLDDRSIGYTERDATNPVARQEMFRRYGVLTVPVVVIGRSAFFGFEENRQAIERALIDVLA
ncbi:MAG: glutaredoxin family protein [Dehalococcoidia bacterium]